MYRAGWQKIYEARVFHMPAWRQRGFAVIVPRRLGGGTSPACTRIASLERPGRISGSVPWNIVVLLTLLTLLPALVLSMTPFVRLLVVFHFLRQALGTQTTPTNQTLIGLALVLTFFLMQPVMTEINQQRAGPLPAGKAGRSGRPRTGFGPLRHFMLQVCPGKRPGPIPGIGANIPRPARADDVGMRVVVPAYILSELKAGFQIGAALYLPFLVVDMVVASITTSVGMLQLPPVVISTPAEDPFVCDGGWLEPAGGFADEEFLLRKEIYVNRSGRRHGKATLLTALSIVAPLLADRHGGQPGDQHRASADFAAGEHPVHRAAVERGGGRPVPAVALDGAKVGGVHPQRVFRLSALSAHRSMECSASGNDLMDGSLGRIADFGDDAVCAVFEQPGAFRRKSRQDLRSR